jgi:iron complex outermembrane recepter protein
MKYLFAAVAVAPLIAGMAHAQDHAEDEVRIEQTVIVTLPGPQRTAGELVSNVAALDRKEIVEALASTLGDTLDRQPGVASTAFGQGASRPVLRGLGAERVQVLTNGIGVIDVSAASPDHQVAADGIDAQKVEILRGPAALVYGGQAIGGVVNVIDGLIMEDLPKRPFAGEAYGATNTVNEGSEGGARVQAVKGPIVATLTASTRDFGNYDIPVPAQSDRLRAETGDPAGPDGELPNSFVQTNSVAGGLSWIGEKGFLGGAVRQQSSQYGLPLEETAYIDLKQTRYDVRGGLNVDNGFLTKTTASGSVADYEHTEFEAPGEPGTIFKTEGFEGRIEVGHVLGPLQGEFGIQYADSSLDAIGDEAFITPTDTTSLGAFVYETHDFDSGLGVEGGIRVEQVDLDNESGGKAGFDLFSGSAGVHQHWESGWFLGAQASWAERAPNQSELFADGPHLATEQYEVGDRTLGKERGLNLEGTARWDSDTMSFGVNLFLTDFSDFIYLAATGAELDDLPVFVFRQQDAQFTGGEVFAEYQLLDGPLKADWKFDAGLDLVNAEFDDGSDVPYVPPVTLNAGAEADWGALALGAKLTWAGDQDSPGAGLLPTDGYVTADLHADLDIARYGAGREGTKLFIEARNIGDAEVRAATSVLKDSVPMPGRNIRAGIRFLF